MRLLLLLTLIAATAVSALPACTYNCTGLAPTGCNAVCRGVCVSYNCSVTSCTGSTYWSTYCPTIHPVCRTVCPTPTGILTDTCPVCTDVCNPLPTECSAIGCATTCQTHTDCTWTCVNPTNCAIPTCTLTCADSGCDTTSGGALLKPAFALLLALVAISVLG